MPIYKMNGKKNGLQKYRVRINYVDQSGKSRQLDRVAYGYDEAKELERQLNYNLTDETRHKITLQELYDEYIKVKKREVRETTSDKSEKLLSTFVLPKFKDMRIDRLTTKMLQEWKSGIDDRVTSTGKPFSLKYKKNIFGEFRALLNYAVKMEYLERNLLSVVGNFKKTSEVKKEMDFYTPEEFIAFRNISRSCAEEAQQQKNSIYEWNFYVFFNIAFYTGMRKGEIYALKWTDIKDDTIYITRSIAQKLKGGDRETAPKNESSVRDIQIPVPLKKVLDEHYRRYKQLPRFSDDWRICGGERCLRDSTVTNRNVRYAQQAKIKKIRIHDFRHSHASLLANSHINVQEISRRLGHANIEITWNTYSHLYPREKERALEILDKII